MNRVEAFAMGVLATALGLGLLVWAATRGGFDVHGCHARGGVVVRRVDGYRLACVEPQ
jgi:hypothetical protein